MNTTIRHAALTAALALISSTAAQAQDGSFDPTFNHTGRGLYQQRGWGGGIAALSDGRLIVAGDCQTLAGPSGICVSRLLADGTDDYLYFNGGNGTKILGDSGAFPGEHKFALHGLALQADDHIVLASYDANADLGNPGQSRLTRLTRDGFFETLASGQVYAPVVFQASYPDPTMTNSVANGVAIAPDGKIVVAGAAHLCCYEGGALLDPDMGVARFNTDMTPDAGFGNDGGTTIAFDQGGDNFDRASAVAVQRDGKIVIAGVARSADGSVNFDAALVRLNINGTLDSSFGNGGRVTLPPISQPDGPVVVSSVNTVAIDPHGRILIAGSVIRFDLPGTNLITDEFVARFTPDGVLDTSFGHFVGGVTIISWSFTDPTTAEAFGLTLQGDGKILMYGWAATNQQPIPASYWVMNRLLPNGTDLDPTFSSAAYGGYSPPQGPFPASNDARGAVIANGGLNFIGRAFDYGGDNYFGVAKLRLDAIFNDGFEP